MRPFEILTFVTLLFSLITLFLRKRYRWFVYVPGCIFFVVLCQVVFEGVRWQMIPIYAFASILFLINLIRVFIAKRELPERLSLLKRILKISVILITFLLLILTLIPPLAVPMFKIPHPSGKFGVGSSILFFRDTTLALMNFPRRKTDSGNCPSVYGIQHHLEIGVKECLICIPMKPDILLFI